MWPLNRTRRAAIACMAAILIGQQGCAVKPVKAPLLDNTDLSGERIAVVIQKEPDKTTLKMPGKGVGTSIGRGAGTGALMGVGVGAACGWGAIVCVPVGVAVGTMGGAAYGGIAADKSSKWDKAESIFRANLTELDFDHLLIERLIAFAKENGYALYLLETPASGDVPPVNYSELSRKGVNLVLELSEIVVELRPRQLVDPANPPRQLSISIRSRIIRTVDGAILDDRVMTDDETDFYPLDDWMLSNGLKFRKKVFLLAQRMPETIITELFFQGNVTGLEPVSPSMDTIHCIGFANSLQPTLKWQSFQGEDVTYDLKIWRSQDGRDPTELVYGRERLTKPYHNIEAPLQPDTCYLWTVRARFKMAGQTRVTGWSTLPCKPYPFIGEPSSAPSKYYRFVTP